MYYKTYFDIIKLIPLDNLKPINKFYIILVAAVFLGLNTSAQEALKYQIPPAEIVKIVDAPQTP